METLTQMKCVACRKDAPTVTDAEIAELHPQVSDWEVVELDGTKRLRRVFPFDDFAQALAFTNKVGELAEREGHHPALLTESGRTRSHGGPTRSGAFITTTSSWRRRPTSCNSHEPIRSIDRDPV
jgi:4a-hydroxytetrahydrobiopterin dehydratase